MILRKGQISHLKLLLFMQKTKILFDYQTLLKNTEKSKWKLNKMHCKKWICYFQQHTGLLSPRF